MMVSQRNPHIKISRFFSRILVSFTLLKLRHSPLVHTRDGRTVMSLVCHVTSLSHVFQFWSVTVTSLSRFFRDKDVTITSLSQFFRDEGVIVTGLSRISKFRVVTVTSMSRFFRAKRVTSTSLSLSLYCHWFVMGYAQLERAVGNSKILERLVYQHF